MVAEMLMSRCVWAQVGVLEGVPYTGVLEGASAQVGVLEGASRCVWAQLGVLEGPKEGILEGGHLPGLTGNSLLLAEIKSLHPKTPGCSAVLTRCAGRLIAPAV